MLQRNSDYDYQAPEYPAGPAIGKWQQPTVDLREMARILRRRWTAVAAAPLALIVLALIYVMAVPTLYTATSTVLVDPRRANVVDTSQTVLSNFGTDDATIESQALLIQSVAILQRVVARLKLTADPEFMRRPVFSIRSDGCSAAVVRLMERAPRMPRRQDRSKFFRGG